MLGYVRINKPELKVKDYELYKGLYCSVCKAMGKHFGLLSRLTLSYDITFLVLVRMSFLGMIPDFKNGRCPFNPGKKCNYCKNGEDEFRYAAAVSMIMFYYKVKDNICDSSFFKKLIIYLILPYAYLKYKKAKRLFPEIEEIISVSMKRQNETEKSKTDSSDKAAHESAHALGKIMAWGFDDSNGQLYRFGYGIGKWVYLCDAADDIKKDLKSGSFNAYVNKFSLKSEKDVTQKVKDEIMNELNMSVAMSCDAFHNIPDKNLVPLCENIIYEGTEIVMNNILKGKNDNERSI